MISFWEQQSFVKYDYIVIGGGIVGLSTAASIKEANAKASVLVLERGLLPSGASTKNAGFACFGSLTELLDDLNSIGEQGMLELVQMRLDGLNKLRNRLGDSHIDYQNHGGFELIREAELPYLDKIDRINGLLQPLLQGKTYELVNSVDEFGFNRKLVHEMVFNPYEGQIDTGKMMKNLIGYVRSLGVDILTGAEVLGFEDNTESVSVTVKSGSEENLLFKSCKLAVCVNAFAKRFFPEKDIKPGRGLVLVTKPFPVAFQGTFHFDKGFYYFRNFENRIIFGGGRNIAEKEEETMEFEINEKILENLKENLERIIIPSQPYEIDHVWTGIMAFGETKQPILERISENIVAGVRLGGMGVAIGSLLGEKIAQFLD